MATKSNPSDVAQLATQLGGDNAAAVATFVDGRIAAALEGLRQEILRLVARQSDNVAAAKDEGSSEAAKVANTGTKAVKAADEAVKEAEADPTSAKTAKAKTKVDEATQVVSSTEADLVALTTRVSAVEEVIAPWREGEELGSRPASRFDPIEEDLVVCRDQITALRGGFDQVASASAEALAIARVGDRGPALWLVGLVTFVVALLVAGLLAIFTPLTFFWDAWWLAGHTTMFVVLCTAILDRAAPAAAKGFAQGRAQARSRSRRRNAVANDAGLGIMEPREAAAEADAEVDHDRSAAGARASAG